ncbi:MAG: NAD(P)-dependent glycerol-3-phosphate dehydrogenase [Candidatus Eisenbacteria sp.]|nr:NAD(P)-dependent glycerol-3-phosphate dehydrogenase [Candidatus Eisenbacteria bacterium]
MSNTTILGAGSWGSTLGLLLAAKGDRVRFWEHDPEVVSGISRDSENRKFLPGIPWPESVMVSGEMREALDGADFVVFAVPSQVLRSVVRSAAPLLDPKSILTSVVKGIEKDTLARMSEVLSKEIGGEDADFRLGVLLGPSLAYEVARSIPTTVVASSASPETARKIADRFRVQYFRVYTNDDLIGVELGVSLKNVIAIAAGICDGLGYGDNTKGALLTRGLAEISRLGVEMGARRETFAGLTGMGDLITTCISPHSRNRHVGEEIGRGRTLREVLDEMVMVAEGVETAVSAVQLSRKVGVELPITEQIHRVLFEDKSPAEAITELMTRDPKNEF